MAVADVFENEALDILKGLNLGEADPVLVGSLNAIITLADIARKFEGNVNALAYRCEQLEAENARLKKQCEHLACDVVSAAQDYGAPMSDCRSCDYDRFCKRKPGQIEPNWDMCEEAVLKACEPVESEE